MTTQDEDSLCTNPDFDKHGHLVNWQDWSPALAKQMAARDKVQLTEAHWALFNLLRDLYAQTGETPPMRLFIRVIRDNLGEEMATSRFLYRLFPDAPIKHLCRYAGLPKPPHCI